MSYENNGPANWEEKQKMLREFINRIKKEKPKKFRQHVTVPVTSPMATPMSLMEVRCIYCGRSGRVEMMETSCTGQV